MTDEETKLLRIELTRYVKSLYQLTDLGCVTVCEELEKIAERNTEKIKYHKPLRNEMIDKIATKFKFVISTEEKELFNNYNYEQLLILIYLMDGGDLDEMLGK